MFHKANQGGEQFARTCLAGRCEPLHWCAACSAGTSDVAHGQLADHFVRVVEKDLEVVLEAVLEVIHTRGN